jgi:hypothetical protein
LLLVFLPSSEISRGFEGGILRFGFPSLASAGALLSASAFCASHLSHPTACRGILSLTSKSLEWSVLSASPLCASDFSLPDGNVYKSEAQEDHFLSAL